MNDDLKVGMELPVFGQQLKGCYIDSRDGLRYAHFAVPGWYRVAAIEGESVHLERITMDQFVASKRDLEAVMFANIECVVNGVEP